jgi:hypothetical protein
LILIADSWRRLAFSYPASPLCRKFNASLLTQALDESRRKRNAAIQARLDRGEIKAGYAFFLMHPILCIWFVGTVAVVTVIMVFSIAGELFRQPAEERLPFSR